MDNTTQQRRTMTFRDLMRWLNNESARRDDRDLDMVVTLRIEDDEGMLHVGALYDVEVDAGCGDDDQLVLDAAQDVEDAAPAGLSERLLVAAGRAEQ